MRMYCKNRRMIVSIQLHIRLEYNIFCLTIHFTISVVSLCVSSNRDSATLTIAVVLFHF
jgi:hypothetical protein